MYGNPVPRTPHWLGIRKNNVNMHRLFFTSIIIFSLFSCTSEADKVSSISDLDDSNSIEIFGNTQGTSYSIICIDPIEITKEEIDQTLEDFDMALSSWVDSSIISKINRSESGTIAFKDPQYYFNNCYQIATEVYQNTNGAFEPTVGQLLSLWKFDDRTPTPPDSSEIEQALKNTSFEPGAQFEFLPAEWDSLSQDSIYFIRKIDAKAQLDFNAIAQGLSVDILCELLDKKGAKNYLVEIGGELRSKGKNAEGHDWRIGIDQPIENSNAEDRKLNAIASISNSAIATSGNYRKFFIHNGKKYSHTINPKTGYPVTHNLLSATVIARTAAEADAYATAFMVWGLENTKDFIHKHPELGLNVYLIASGNEDEPYVTFTSSNMKKLIEVL